MSVRYTRRDAERAVQRLAEALELPYGHYVTVEDEPGPLADERPDGRYKVQRSDGAGWMTTQPGALEVDYNPTYGGCVIVQIAPDGGTWVRHPFSQTRMSPRAFVEYVNGVIAGIHAGREGVRA